MKNPKVIAAIFAAAIGACGVLYPDYSGMLNVIAGMVLGKEYLPQTKK